MAGGTFTIQNTYSDEKGIKLGINNRKTTRISTNTWKLNSTLETTHESKRKSSRN